MELAERITPQRDQEAGTACTCTVSHTKIDEMFAREPIARYLHAAVSVEDKLFIWEGYGDVQMY